MASITVPYLVEKPGRGGSVRYFWQPGRLLRDAGWRPQRIPDHWQGIADPLALRAAAIARAQGLNAEVEAWRQGAPQPGTVKAKVGRRLLAPGSLAAIIAGYKRAPRWADPASRNALSSNTKRVYAQHMELLERWGGKVPARAITPKMVQELYEPLWRRSPSIANGVVAVLRLLLEFARREGLVAVNVALRPDMSGLPPSGRIWPAAAVDLFVRIADLRGQHSLGTFMVLNEWLGQREGDALGFDRALLRHGRLLLRQSKTGAGVMLPIAMVERLTRRLAAEIARQDARWGVPLDGRRKLILNETTGEPWNGHTFRHAFAELRAIAATFCPRFDVDYLIAGDDGEEAVLRTEDLQAKHFRHTAVVRLAEAGCDDPLISAVTGHTLASVKRILERYLVRTGAMAAEAFAKRLAKEEGV